MIELSNLRCTCWEDIRPSVTAEPPALAASPCVASEPVRKTAQLAVTDQMVRCHEPAGMSVTQGNHRQCMGKYMVELPTIT